MGSGSDPFSVCEAAALFREAQPAQRLTNRLPNLRAAGMGPNEAGDGEAGLQLRHPSRRRPGLVPAAEEGQRGGLQHEREAEPRICLDRLAAGEDAATTGILRVANNEGHGIIRRTLVSRTMRDLVVGSAAAL